MKISHHRDARGPTLCVKCYNITRDVPADAEGTDAQQQRAWEDAGRAWWHGAELIAQRHGFRKVWSTGRMGGWLYTDPMPQPPTDEDGNETGDAEYPAAFVAELSAHLDRAPEMYAEALAEIIADDADADARQAERDAMPSRLAVALAAMLRARGIDDTDQTTGETFRELARVVLDDYREQLRDAYNVRELTDDEAEALAAIAGGAA